MAFINAETKLPKLLLDYVDSRRVALELPVSGTLPFLEQLLTTYRTLPCVVFYCEGFTQPHPRLMRLVIQVDLLTKAEDTTAADECAWVAALRRALSDGASLSAWLAALSEPNRTGWRMTGYVLKEGGLDLDADQGTRTRRTTLDLRCQATETAGF